MSASTDRRRAFLEIPRQDPPEREVAARVHDYLPVETPIAASVAHAQAQRCMGCGVPFCHAGCPLGNAIPDFHDAIVRGRWEEAFSVLDRTNNFPEVTGRVCPAPCEAACVLGIGADPVAIEGSERALADRAFEAGWVRPRPPSIETGKKVTVIGSGPAGLAAAQELRRVGHRVVVIERAEKAGGLLRFGIPDFKLDKTWIDRRLAQLEAEGVEIRCGVELGRDVMLDTLAASEDAVVLATGATVPRDLPIEGRDASGIHFAMRFLGAQNRVVSGAAASHPIDARGRHVIVLGGGDTGSDCVGTSLRNGAASVTSIELLPRPPDTRAAETPWPSWPTMFRVSSSHEEGGERLFALRTRRFVVDASGRVSGLETIGVAKDPTGALVDVPGTEQVIAGDLVLLALGFVGVEPEPLVGIALERGAVRADARFATSMPKVFACGDARRGPSLVVWAIWEGRRTAAAVDAFFGAKRRLPIASTLAPEIPLR